MVGSRNFPLGPPLDREIIKAAIIGLEMRQHKLDRMLQDLRSQLSGDSRKEIEVPDDLISRLPIIAHETTGADCCGCVVVRVTDNDAELQCNECGAVLGVLRVEVLRDMVGLIPAMP